MINGVKIKPPPSHWARRKITRVTIRHLHPVTLKASKGLGYQLSKLTLANRNDLLTHLRNKLAEMRPARKRRHSGFGKFINAIKMAETKSIELDGIIFCGLLELLDENAEVELNRRYTYLVPFEEAERMLVMLEG